MGEWKKYSDIFLPVAGDRYFSFPTQNKVVVGKKNIEFNI